MRSKYLLRFDDLHERMNFKNFLKIKRSVDDMGIKSILGVIPDCKDQKLISGQIDRHTFFHLIRSYKMNGDSIAQHGYQHLYHTDDSGLLGINKASEFAGLSYTAQLSSIKKGMEILQKQGVWEPIFMAPSHSFDLNTLQSLKELGFKYLTDGYGVRPHVIYGLTLIPQLTSKPIPFIRGVQTMCLHTDTMSESDLAKTIRFIEKNKKHFVDFQNVALNVAEENWIDIIIRGSSKILLKTYRSIVSNVKI